MLVFSIYFIEMSWCVQTSSDPWKASQTAALTVGTSWTEEPASRTSSHFDPLRPRSRVKVGRIGILIKGISPGEIRRGASCLIVLLLLRPEGARSAVLYSHDPPG